MSESHTSIRKATITRIRSGSSNMILTFVGDAVGFDEGDELGDDVGF